MPSSADAVSSESSSLFSYRATASRLNCSEYLDVVVDRQSCQPDWVEYQMSTKQGRGQAMKILTKFELIKVFGVACCRIATLAFTEKDKMI